MVRARRKDARGRMTHWTAGTVAISLASVSSVASAQNCETIPAGPARTDCYIGQSRIYQGQSNVAAGKARVQTGAARYQQVTGTRSRSKPSKHRRKKLPQLARNELKFGRASGGGNWSA